MSSIKTADSKRKNLKNRFIEQKVLAPMVLVAFFVYAVSPSVVQGSQSTVHGSENADSKLPPFEKGGIEGGFIKSTPNPSFTKGGEQQGNFSFTPPTTINNKTEEIDDYDQFDNGIPRVIPVDSSQNGSQFTVHGSQIYTGSSKCKPTASSSTNGGWGWDGEKGCKLGAESSFIDGKVSPSFSPLKKGGLRGDLQKSTPNPSFAKGGELRKSTPNPSQTSEGELGLTTFINYLQAFLIASYATKPIDRNMVLSNYETYLYLKKQAKARKDKALNKNEKDFNLQKKNLLAKLQQFIKSIKDKFKTKLNNYQSTKTNLTNRLTTVRQTITSLTNQLNQRQSLQQRLAKALANFNYFQSKENQERNAYNQEKKEEKHNKKKYKKYKHKYKKKHKKKYKHRYKKYKRRYKEHKKRAQRHKNNYQSYERQKRAQANLYNQLRQQLASLNNIPNQLNSLRQEESVLQSNLNNLTPPVYNNSSEEDAKRKYQEDLNNLNTTHQNKQKEIETNYQEDLTNTQTYQDNLDYLFDTSSLYTLTKSEREDYLNNLHQTVTLAKQEAVTRINNRYQKTTQMAEIVSKGLPKNSLTLVNVLNSKVSEARHSLEQMKHKVKDLKEAYEDNKDYKKDVKKYAKKVKKYTKKVKKYRHNKKKYKKYNNKLSSAKKKYDKYLKKYLKYGSLKKAYKQSYKSAKNILKQYEEQFSFLIREQQQAQREYQASLKEASDFKNELIKQAQAEKSYYQDRLKLAEVRLDYDQIARTDNSDLDSYLSFVPATVSSASLASSFGLNFSVGLGALDKLKKSLKKLKKKAKKAYKKAEKKAKKKQEEARRREQARRDAQRSAYYARLNAWKKAEAKHQAAIKEHTWFDSNGNGYSGFYSEAGGYSHTPPKPRWSDYLSFTSHSSTPATIKKSWWSKVKDSARNSWNNFKAHPVKATLNNTWKTLKWFPPIAATRGIGWGGKLWYDSYKSKDTFDKVHQVVNTVSATAAAASLAMGATGVGVIPAVVTTAIGSISDLISASMYGMKGEWGDAGLMAVGAIPVFGDIMQVGRIVKYGVEGAEIARGAGKVSGVLSKEGKFYEWFAQAGYEKNFEKMTKYKGFERVVDNKLLESMLGLRKKSLKILKDSRTSVFYNKATNKFILTSGGTRATKLGDWLDDFKNVFGFKSKQHKAAQELAEIIKNSSNKIQATVGHSLGGAKAKIIGLPNDIKTYTFNTAFAHKKWLKGAVRESIDFAKTGDALTYLQTESLLKKLFPKQFGKTIKYGEDKWDMLPNYNLRARVLKFVYGVGRHGIN